MTTIVKISLPPRVPMATHLVWDALQRMQSAPTADLKVLWCSRYQQFKKLRGDYDKRPEGSAPG